VTEPLRLALGRALAEMERRNDHLAAAGLLDAGADFTPVEADFTPVEAVTHCSELNAADIRAAAEQVARMGRKARVTLVVLVPDTRHPYRDYFGGPALLRDFAEDGRAVRLIREDAS
jgi:hypothetical protein